ncbi:MAG: citramalate synthase [Chloroflexi bacterium]|nr:citramalate synthase [Chloroflexota bacterium]
MIQLYDCTLRDGAQREGISLTAEDKLKIAQRLDEMGIHFIEGGWPGSNPKDVEFFRRAKGFSLNHAKLVAFGSTRRAGVSPERDANLRALVAAGTPVVTIVGKSWDFHVTQVLETTLKENLAMIFDSVSYLKAKGLTVFFDAEHFFDGFKANKDYALKTLGAAARAGAHCLVLCDTNGGSLPTEIAQAITAVKEAIDSPLGIHTHNDAELAVANSLVAVRLGVSQVQGTINGYGERCGNANLCSVIPALQLKMGIPCISDEQLSRLTEVAHYVSEIVNLVPDAHQPYVGRSAFGHKAGLHVSAFMKCPQSYQHLPPEMVGNKSRVLVSELSGQSNVVYKARERGLKVDHKDQAQAILEQVKTLENQGFQFDGAEASFDLLVKRAQPDYQPPFELVDFMVVVEKRRRPPSSGKKEESLSEAMVKVRIRDEVIHTAAEGNGPVNALDAALRKALLQFYPHLASVRLTDYKVRILDESGGTGSQVRVLIESTDGRDQWRTVGSSANIIEASWLALVDSLEHWLLKEEPGEGFSPPGSPS